MRPEVAALLGLAVARLQGEIACGQCPAIAVLGDGRRLVLSDYDYLRDPESARAFEVRAAQHAADVHAVRGAFAVPQVLVEENGHLLARAVSNHPLRPGESEAILWLAWDVSGDVDYGRVLFTRRPNGEPVFDDMEIFQEPVRPRPELPGYHLLTTVMAEPPEPTC